MYPHSPQSVSAWISFSSKERNGFSHITTPPTPALLVPRIQLIRVLLSKCGMT